MSQPIPTLPVTSTHCAAPPKWALLMRGLLDRLDSSIDPYLAKYVREDGWLIYRDDWVQGRDGLDDLYESFYNFPLLYLLGGADRLLPLAHRQWEAMTEQGASFSLVHDEYEVGYDQFHQSEGNLFFYFLCAADPANPKLVHRARRFAGLYLNESEEAPNYDGDLNIIRAVHNGSRGPRWGYIDKPDVWTARMEPYDIPFTDLPGIASFADVTNVDQSERAKANRQVLMDVMNDRMGRGDSAANLPVTSLMANAFMMTGDAKYRDWVRTYVGGWWARAEANGGILPDNVGLGGQVGEYFSGRWYGAAYGWSWPHGYDSVIDAATVAAINAALLTGDLGWLDLPGKHFDMLYRMGHVVPDFREIGSSIGNSWIRKASESTGRFDAYVMPKRIRDDIWFDYQTVGIANTVAAWSVSFDPSELARLTMLEAHEPYDWATSYVFHSKGDDSHDRPWLAFLDGRFPDYPAVALEHAIASVDERLSAIASDQADLRNVHIHHWQNHLPVTTEALVQLSLGAPQALYNGGFINCCFRYFDPDASRPGLPPDISALVSSVAANSAKLELVNLSRADHRRILVQGGFQAEHRILWVETEVGRHIAVGANRFLLELPPSSRLVLRVGIERQAYPPSYVSSDYTAAGRNRHHE